MQWLEFEQLMKRQFIVLTHIDFWILFTNLVMENIFYKIVQHMRNKIVVVRKVK